MYIDSSIVDNQEVAKSLILQNIFTSSDAMSVYSSPGNIVNYGGAGANNNAYIPASIMNGVGFTLHDTGQTLASIAQSTPSKLIPAQYWIALNPYLCYSGVTKAPDYVSQWKTQTICSTNCHSAETITVTIGLRMAFENGKTGTVTATNTCTLPTSAGTVTFSNDGWEETFRYDTVNYGTNYSPASGTNVKQVYFSAITVQTSTNTLSAFTVSDDVKLYITRGPISYVYDYHSLTSGNTKTWGNNIVAQNAIVNSTNSGMSKYNFALKIMPNLKITPTFKDVVTWNINVTRPSNSQATTLNVSLQSYNHGHIQAQTSVTIPANGTSGSVSYKFRPNDVGFHANVVIDSISPSTHTATISSGDSVSSLPSAGTITTNISVSTVNGYTVTVANSSTNFTVSDMVSGYGSHSFNMFKVYAVTIGGDETLLMQKNGTTYIYPPSGSFTATRSTTTVNYVKYLKMELQPNVLNGVNGIVIKIGTKEAQLPMGAGTTVMEFKTSYLDGNMTIGSGSMTIY